jgi:hypothetical protein
MVYNWDDKEPECYRLYVEEKKSLDEVIAYWEVRGFTPRYVTAQLNVWVAVYFCHPSQTLYVLAYFTARDDADDGVQAKERSRHSSRHDRFLHHHKMPLQSLIDSHSDGTSPASRTRRTRTPPSSPAYTSYGSRTIPRRTWWRLCRVKVTPSTTAN